jgi:hypothetical protein
MPEPTHWMIVTSPENFATTKRLRFTMQGVKSRHRRKAERMRPGDRLTWFLTGVQAFAGAATIASTFWEDHAPVWVSKKADEDYPFRFKIRKEIVLDEDHWVPARSLLPKLRFVKKWPAEHWRLAFQGNVHELIPEDFRTIERAISKAATAETKRISARA